MTQTQLQELLETEPARVLLEGAEERGFVLPAELEAIGLEVGEPAAEPEEEAQKAREAAAAEAAQQQAAQPLVGAADSLQLFQIGRASCRERVYVLV